jgi:YggT family protein
MSYNTEPQHVNRQEQVRVHQHSGYERQIQVVEDHNTERRLAVSRVAGLIWLMFGILVASIGLRVALKLIAANAANPFAGLLYAFTDLFLRPFSGLTITPSAQGMVLEIPAIIAMFVYALVGWVIVRLVWLVFYQPAARSVRTVEREHDDLPQ